MNFKFLFTLAATACMAAPIHAQTITETQPAGQNKAANDYKEFSIGLNAGVCRNTQPANGRNDDKAGVTSGTAGLGFYYRVNKHWEIGAAADYKMLSVRAFNRLRFEDDFDPATGTYVHELSYYNETVFYPSITARLLINYHFALGKLDAYAGVSAGYLTIMRHAANEKNSLMWKVQPGTGSFVPGVYIGAGYPISRHWSLNAQLGGEGVFIASTMTHLDVIAATGTLGIRYRF